MAMRAAVTINLRIPLDLYEWIEEQGQATELSPTTAARALLAKARAEGVSLTTPATVS